MLRSDVPPPADVMRPVTLAPSSLKIALVQRDGERHAVGRHAVVADGDFLGAAVARPAAKPGTTPSASSQDLRAIGFLQRFPRLQPGDIRLPLSEIVGERFVKAIRGRPWGGAHRCYFSSRRGSHNVSSGR